MASSDVDPLSRRNRLKLAFTSYDTDVVNLVEDDLGGASHLVGTRKGIYAVSDQGWKQIAYGYFYGITLRDGDIYAFEACDQPHSSLARGRIIKLLLDGVRITRSIVLAKGLDNGCHQIDFLGDRLHVTDTYNQVIQRFDPECQSYETLKPLPIPPAGRWEKADPRHVHVNSILAVGDTILLLLHNNSEYTNRLSEVAVYSRNWEPLGRWVVQGRSCHGLALLEDGTLLTCDSVAGDLISANGLRVDVSPHMTRGLSVGPDSLVVGGSTLTKREDRLDSAGTVTFMDREYNIRSVVDIPGAPMEIRRLDGQDSGLSRYLEQVVWGRRLKEGEPV